MDNEIELVQPRRLSLDPLQQCRRLEVVVEAEGHEVFPLFRAVEDVNDDGVVKPAPVQFPKERATDETRAAGQEQPARYLELHPDVFYQASVLPAARKA